MSTGNRKLSDSAVLSLVDEAVAASCRGDQTRLESAERTLDDGIGGWIDAVYHGGSELTRARLRGAGDIEIVRLARGRAQP